MPTLNIDACAEWAFACCHRIGTVQLTAEGHSVKTLEAFHYVLLESQVPFWFRLSEHPPLQVKMTDGLAEGHSSASWTDMQLFTRGRRHKPHGPGPRLSSGQYFSSPDSCNP